MLRAMTMSSGFFMESKLLKHPPMDPKYFWGEGPDKEDECASGLEVVALTP